MRRLRFVAVLQAALALLAPAAAQRAATLPPGARLLSDQPYGSAVKQRLDVYLPAESVRPVGGKRPILVMVHGGAWAFGDKSSLGVVGAKRDHWLADGWIFVSVNNRLLGEADPATQADDVAHALAWVQAHASGWGADPRRVVLMGHSAGAHLVALLGADPSRAASAGARRWAATIALDSAALDLVSLMQARHPRFYDRAFGTEPAGWADASPTARLVPGATPMLLVCSTRRIDDSCGQSERFAARLRAIDVRAEVLPQPLPHNRIDVELGRDGDYTKAVDAFIASTLPAARIEATPGAR